MGIGTTTATSIEMDTKVMHKSDTSGVRAIMIDFESVRHRAPISVITDGCALQIQNPW